MKLSKNTIKKLASKGEKGLPDREFAFPERVLQFGTGVLLRGLPDYFIDQANKKGIFKGRIVVVKSTSLGDTQPFYEQDGLYTLCVRGVEKGKKVEENHLNASISRVLSAQDSWGDILDCAANPKMEIIISNTTEVGIKLTEDDILASPPQSFPGKLLAFLFHRYNFFNGDKKKGMIIIPTELIPDNGTCLVEILNQLAIQNQLDDHFVQWMNKCNVFCNSLVDRIVPGALPETEKKHVEKQLGFTDNLMIMAESYRLWAIETNSQKVHKALGFAKTDEGIFLVPDISEFRERKLRLLNGAHTFSCGLAFLAGFPTVGAAMDDKTMETFISQIMKEEIVPVLAESGIDAQQSLLFADQVLDRFRNPYIKHYWLNISMQYTSKMAMRNMPTLKTYISNFQTVPERMALGMAAYIAFMRCSPRPDGSYFGMHNSVEYTITDTLAPLLSELWDRNGVDGVVAALFGQSQIWGEDINALPMFGEKVSDYLKKIMAGELNEIMQCLQENKMSEEL